jgi:uncharacterized protein (DUF1800 family)
VKRFKARKFTYADAAHLLRRAGFSGSVAETQAYQALGPELAVERLLYWSADDGTQDNPFDLRKVFQAQEDGNKASGAARGALPGWWVYRLVHTTQPLKEKLTLFWHGHFATEMQKVDNAFAMQQQNELFRQFGLGKFEALVMAISKNPAMLRYLDNNRNVKGKPNENYARELMELFTLGVHGGYTEKDIQESARAFTGWSFQSGNQNKPAEWERYMNPVYAFDKKKFDEGAKTYLGKTGNFTGEDIVRIACAHPSTPKFIITKLWKFFVNDTISGEDLESLAGVWQSSGGEIASVLRTIFTSEAFYSSRNRASVIKSPTEYAVGMLRAVETKLAPEQALGVFQSLRVMGQTLFNPPNVKGWDGGTDWVSDTMLLNRLNLVGGIASARLPAQLAKDQKAPSVVMSLPKGSSVTETIDLLGVTFLGEIPDGALRKTLETFAGGKNTPDVIRGLTYLVLASPQYHLA